MILDSVQDSPPVIFVSGALRVTARLSYGEFVFHVYVEWELGDKGIF